MRQGCYTSPLSVPRATYSSECLGLSHPFVWMCVSDCYMPYLFLSAELQSESSCGKSNPSLVWSLLKTFWMKLIASAVLNLCQVLISFVSPQLLK